MRDLISLFRCFRRDQRGSNVAQAAALALVVIVLLAGLFGGLQKLVPSVGHAFDCLVGSLGGGGGCPAGSSAAGGSGQTGGAQRVANPPPDPSRKPCPSMSGTSFIDGSPPRNMAELVGTIYKQYRDTATQPNPEDQQGPIGITQIGPNRYLVTLTGIEFDNYLGDANTLDNAALSGLGLQSEYEAVVKETIEEQIPDGAEIVLAGHSHGGIVAENLARDGDFNNNRDPGLLERIWGKGGRYHVSDVITFGSPVSGGTANGVRYHMYAAEGDFVPWFGALHPFSEDRLLASGDLIRIPRAPGVGFGVPAHSGYAAALRAIEQDPKSPYNNRRYLDLPFTIDSWSQTETFHADRWDAYNQWPWSGRCR